MTERLITDGTLIRFLPNVYKVMLLLIAGVYETVLH
jgi:hypothetical protein